MDLQLFQFDYDMSFAVTFLNPDRTVYGRYGTRDGKEEHADSEISLEGLAAAMRGALELHAGYPGNRRALAGKQPLADSKYPVPEKMPSLGKYKSVLDYEGKVAGSCIHCHSIHDEPRREARNAGELLGMRTLSPWPMPSVLGFRMDPAQRATVAAVAPGTAAEAAGLRAGDTISTANRQPLLSTADLQWVLHRMEDADPLALSVERDGQQRTIEIKPQPAWRASTDLDWRVSTWDLRRMALGGMYLERVPEGERVAGGLPPAGKMALRARHVGQYGDHAVAKRAGLQNGDVLVGFNGSADDLTESQLLKRTVSTLARDTEVKVSYLRDGTRHEATFRLQ